MNNKTATLEDAIAIAAQAHKGIKDKAGAAYILHPLRMMMRMKTESEMMTAILHDVVEDTRENPEENKWTIEKIARGRLFRRSTRSSRMRDKSRR